MEEPVAPEATPPPPTTAPTQTPPPQPQPQPQPPPPPPVPATTTTTPPPSSAPLPPTTKKRPLDSDAHFQNSNYFKIRAVIRDLRPHFIEVLRTPDYKNCKASNEIREQLKIVVKLYDNMKAEAVSLGKSKNMQDGQPSSGQNLVQEQQPQHVKSAEQSQAEKASARPSEIKLTPPVSGLQNMQAEDSQTQGTYVVGGSAFGWNFITFLGQEPVYYGRTKEKFRSAQVAP